MAIVVLTWRLVSPGSFYRVTRTQPRKVRRVQRYYGKRWPTAAAAAGLCRADNGLTAPHWHLQQQDEYGETLAVQLLPGQTPDDYRAACDKLAHSFRAISCTVDHSEPGWIWLRVDRYDRLSAAIAPVPPAARVDLGNLPIGLAADGSPWCVRVIRSHVLIAGCTGSGKGSVIWSLIRAMAPAVRIGSVVIWAVDPKGGMELAAGKDLFQRFETSPTDYVALLEDAVAEMHARASRLQGVSRTHRPTLDEPLIVVLVDELASLSAYLTDRDLKRRAASALQLLLSQGRAVGVSVIGALQDPSKEVLPYRDLFPTRIALRLAEDQQVDMILGSGARKRGALCDHIPSDLPGVGYVAVDGKNPVRVRAAYLDDGHIQRMATAYRPVVRDADAEPVGATR